MLPEGNNTPYWYWPSLSVLSGQHFTFKLRGHVPLMGNNPTLHRLDVSYKKEDDLMREVLISVGSAHLSKTTLSSWTLCYRTNGKGKWNGKNRTCDRRLNVSNTTIVLRFIMSRRKVISYLPFPFHIQKIEFATSFFLYLELWEPKDSQWEQSDLNR